MAETTPVTRGVNGTLASLGPRVGLWARRRIVWLLVAPAVILVLGYITVPMIYMVRMSFYVRERLEVYQPGTFTIDNYTRFADSVPTKNDLRHSLVLGGNLGRHSVARVSSRLHAHEDPVEMASSAFGHGHSPLHDQRSGCRPMAG